MKTASGPLESVTLVTLTGAGLTLANSTSLKKIDHPVSEAQLAAPTQVVFGTRARKTINPAKNNHVVAIHETRRMELPTLRQPGYEWTGIL